MPFYMFIHSKSYVRLKVLISHVPSCLSVFTVFLNLLKFLAGAFRCHVHHFQGLTVPVEWASCTGTVKHWKWCTWHRKTSANNSSKLYKFLHSEVNLLIQHIIVQDQDGQHNIYRYFCSCFHESMGKLYTISFKLQGNTDDSAPLKILTCDHGICLEMAWERRSSHISYCQWLSWTHCVSILPHLPVHMIVQVFLITMKQPVSKTHDTLQHIITNKPLNLHY